MTDQDPAAGELTVTADPVWRPVRRHRRFLDYRPGMVGCWEGAWVHEGPPALMTAVSIPLGSRAYGRRLAQSLTPAMGEVVTVPAGEMVIFQWVERRGQSTHPIGNMGRAMGVAEGAGAAVGLLVALGKALLGQWGLASLWALFAGLLVGGLLLSRQAVRLVNQNAPALVSITAWMGDDRVEPVLNSGNV